jgi:hypothetical protein
MPEAAADTAAAMRANLLTYLRSKARATDRADPALPGALLAAAAQAVIRQDRTKNL